MPDDKADTRRSRAETAWDYSADVVVMGCGSAGAVAAITAHDAGAKVLVLEKMPEAGGTSRTSGGRMRIIEDPEKAVDYFYRICEGTTPREVLEPFVYEGQNIPEWVKGLGGQIEITIDPADMFPVHIDPLIPGSESVRFERWRIQGPMGAMPPEQEVGGGENFWSLLAPNLQKRNIDILLNTPAKKLMTNESGEVIGVEAEREGKRIRLKARRGVIMSCGGFSANPEMLANYVGQGYYLPYCNPGNTGDGIKMALEVGADLWHMSAVVAGFGYKVPEYDYPIPAKLYSPGYIYLDQGGKRFMNETGVDSHMMWTQVWHWDQRTLSYPRVPSWQIFDDDTFRAGQVATTVRGKIGDVYQWSTDNVPELERGWIIKGDSVGELAQKIGLYPPAFQETVARYNSSCAVGYDPDFNRSLQTLVALIRPPFYAMQIWPCALNTQGGPRRNAQARVLDTYGKPIPRLYSNGEFGSLFHRFYIGACNFRENVVYGRIAGRNAAAEPPWEG